MSKVIVVTSGKGGVGKTTTSASISMGLAMQGYKTVVIDFDVGLRNLDLILDCERRVFYDFVSVINKEATLSQALIKDKREPNLYILAASQTKDKDSLTKEGVESIINELKSMNFDYIICDSPAGIETGAYMAMYFADEAIVVTNPEVSSIRDSDRIIGMIQSKTRKAEKGEEVALNLLLTRYSPKKVEENKMLSINDVLEILNINLIGVIPESEDVITASNTGNPVVMNNESQAGTAYKDLVLRLTGVSVPIKFTTVDKKGFLKRVFGG